MAIYLSLQEVCYQYWPTSGSASIDGEKHGQHTIYTLETKRQDRFIVRKLGITGPNVSVAGNSNIAIWRQ